MKILEKEWSYLTEEAKQKVYNIMVKEGVTSIDLAVEMLIVREGDAAVFCMEDTNVRG